jgi:hypothetical protein
MRRWVSSGGMSSGWMVRAMFTVRIDEGHAGGAQIQVDLEGPGPIRRKLAGDVVHEELDALVAARHVGNEFHADRSPPAGAVCPEPP